MRGAHEPWLAVAYTAHAVEGDPKGVGSGLVVSRLVACNVVLIRETLNRF